MENDAGSGSDRTAAPGGPADGDESVDGGAQVVSGGLSDGAQVVSGGLSDGAQGAGGLTDGGEHPVTGEHRVDAALRMLDELADLPVSEHPQVFERIHGQLVEVLGELHSGPGPANQTDQTDQGRPVRLTAHDRHAG